MNTERSLWEMLLNCLCGMKRKAHGAQEPRHIWKYVEVASTAQHRDSPAQTINQRFLCRMPAFCAVGALGIAVQLGALHFLIHCMRMHYLAATGIAVEAAVLHNFVWHKRWTWANRNITGLTETLKRLGLFHLTNGIVSIIGNILWMRFLVGTMGWNYLPANMTTIAAGFALNFLAGDMIVFRAKENKA